MRVDWEVDGVSMGRGDAGKRARRAGRAGGRTHREFAVRGFGFFTAFRMTVGGDITRPKPVRPKLVEGRTHPGVVRQAHHERNPVSDPWMPVVTDKTV